MNKKRIASILVTVCVIIIVLGAIKIGGPGIIGWEGGIPIIDWRYADQYYGQEVIVEGTIVDTYNSGNACFLNFHTDWKRYFTTVIFQNKFYKFPANPERYYKGKKVHVRGVVQEYEGALEIILEDPSQIEIIG